MSRINWKLIATLALSGGAGVVWVPKALHLGAGSDAAKAPVEMPVMIDPDSGLPIEMPGEPGRESGPEALESQATAQNEAPHEAPHEPAKRPAMAELSPEALLDLASSLRSERIQRTGGGRAEAVDTGSVELGSAAEDSPVEQLLARYPLSATLRAAGGALAVIGGEAVEIGESFGDHGMVLREVGWNSASVEFQGRRYSLTMRAFKADPAASNDNGAKSLPGPVPDMP